MDAILSKYHDDFLDGSETIYNYVPSTNFTYLFYAQIVGIQKLGPNYYNELAMAKEYMVQYTMEGEGSVIIENEEFIVKKGDILIIPNYKHHILKTINGKPWKIAFIHIFDNEIVTRITEKIYTKHKFVIHNVDENKIVPYIKEIISLLSDNLEKNEFKVSSVIYKILMEICEQSNVFKSDDIDFELAGVINFLKQNYNKPIKLKDILTYTNYSKNHLERLFKSKMNMTIKDFISKLRLRKAQELILTTNMYFKGIALSVGLSDYRSLVYLFQNSVGMTPSEYRIRGKKLLKEEKSS